MLSQIFTVTLNTDSDYRSSAARLTCYPPLTPGLMVCESLCGELCFYNILFFPPCHIGEHQSEVCGFLTTALLACSLKLSSFFQDACIIFLSVGLLQLPVICTTGSLKI